MAVETQKRTPTKRYMERAERLLPNGAPRYVHCYDNGGDTADRYTVVFTGRYGQNTGGETLVLGMSAAPFHPQGVGMHCPQKQRPDYPTYGHLGNKIKFSELPADCQKLVLQDYVLAPGIAFRHGRVIEGAL